MKEKFSASFMAGALLGFFLGAGMAFLAGALVLVALVVGAVTGLIVGCLCKVIVESLRERPLTKLPEPRTTAKTLRWLAAFVGFALASLIAYLVKDDWTLACILGAFSGWAFYVAAQFIPSLHEE